MSNKQESNIPWWAIVLGFIFFWPLGMVLLFLSLGGVSLPFDRLQEFFNAPGSRSGSAAQRQTPPTASQVIYSTPTAARPQPHQGQGVGSTPGSATQRPYSYGPAQQPKAAPGTAGKKQRFRKPTSGKALSFWGCLVSFIFLLALVSEISDYGLTYVGDWFPLLGFFCAGLVTAWTGFSRTRMGRRQRLYMGVIGQRSSVFLSDLAGTAGVSEKRVISDLQRMLSDGILPMGYIDRASGRLVLTDKGYEASSRPARAESAPPKPEPKKESSDDDILREIRAVNDSIADPAMSRKIDRIGEITGKILDYQRRDPSKGTELRQFLNYYLPTTLKILKAYAQMEAQGVDGENISATKDRIEGMMDKVVEGFEKQLDQLFQADAMDIAADVEVLERMLDKDGLGSGMTLGG
ncbi:MAG: hypothetical protein HFF05_03625 [Oscillospiraceae bacterium]|nr:hypothetical protein [Oscillospiraceae bacterium]